MSVPIALTARVLQVTFSGASSLAMTLPIVARPALCAAYSESPIGSRPAAMEPMLTIRPHLPRRMSLAASRDTMKAPSRLVLTIAAAAAGGMIIAYWDVSTAALFTTMCTVSVSPRSSANPRVTSAGSDTSTRRWEYSGWSIGRLAAGEADDPAAGGQDVLGDQAAQAAPAPGDEGDLPLVGAAGAAHASSGTERT